MALINELNRAVSLVDDAAIKLAIKKNAIAEFKLLMANYYGEAQQTDFVFSVLDGFERGMEECEKELEDASDSLRNAQSMISE